MSAAEFVRNVDSNAFADRKLWKVGDHYVVTSAVVGSFPETSVFAADEHGVMTDWCELDGSLDAFDHDKAIAGYVRSLDEAEETP